MTASSRKRPSSLPSPPSSEPLRKKLKQDLSESSADPETRSQQQRVHTPCTSRPTEASCGEKRKPIDDDRASHKPQIFTHERTEKWISEEPKQNSSWQVETVSQRDAIEYWATNGSWPEYFGKMSGQESESSNKRRRFSTPSYSSRRRDGSAPPAHTAAYEEELQRYGIMFDDLVTKDSLTSQSKEMCRALLEVKDLPPAYISCSEETFIRKFQGASKCNEERVRRDLTPHIVPSAELLYTIDGVTTLEHVREEMSGDWTKCTLLGGTQPRPDYAYGLSSAAFSEEEHAKMANYTNIDNPTKFTESMYFPFLLCEAKCGRKNINDADRQNVHSASIAVNAIVQLCRSVGEDVAQTLSGQILVFSVSHDNERVKIYGHFPLMRNGRVTFHRYYVHDYSLDSHYGRDRETGSNFTRALYRDFYPLHLERIRQAVARLPDPRTTFTVSDISLSEVETQSSEQFSQETGSSTRPPLRRAQSRGSQGELTLMKQQMARIEQMYKAQLEQQQKQMEQQKEESQKQIDLLNRLLLHERN